MCGRSRPWTIKSQASKDGLLPARNEGKADERENIPGGVRNGKGSATYESRGRSHPGDRKDVPKVPHSTEVPSYREDGRKEKGFMPYPLWSHALPEGRKTL